MNNEKNDDIVKVDEQAPVRSERNQRDFDLHNKPIADELKRQQDILDKDKDQQNFKMNSDNAPKIDRPIEQAPLQKEEFPIKKEDGTIKKDDSLVKKQQKKLNGKDTSKK